VPNLLDIIFRRNLDEPDVPVCPDHHVEMWLRGKLGRPSRFSDQTEEEYTLIYYCPEEGCNQTAERSQFRREIPVPGEPPARPAFARLNERR
jgi:hypothetical protein